MPEIRQNFALQKLNTFGIDAYCSYFVEINSEVQLEEVFRSEIFIKNPRLILGGGSNILFTKNFYGLVIHPAISDICVTEEKDDSVIVRVGAGVIWDDFVVHAINNSWGGIENLSAIPGMIGASPVQNIGAYGAEIMQVLESVEGYDLSSGKKKRFVKHECNFGYRDSIFKTKLKNRFLITYVSYNLKKPPHTLNMGYEALKTKLEDYKIKDIKALREIVCEIRKSKLPDVNEFGNAGSFFKNPEISANLFDKLKHQYPDISGYPASDGKIKLSAAWLISSCGLKGIRYGNTGTYKNQPLVIINYGNARGDEVLEFANKIIQSVYVTFGINLEPEVNIV